MIFFTWLQPHNIGTRIVNSTNSFPINSRCIVGDATRVHHSASMRSTTRRIGCLMCLSSLCFTMKPGRRCCARHGACSYRGLHGFPSAVAFSTLLLWVSDFAKSALRTMRITETKSTLLKVPLPFVTCG